MSIGPVAPVSAAQLALRPITGSGMRIDGGFWGHYQTLNREVTIPHGMRMLEESGSLDNLRVAAGLSAAQYSLPLFRDSDVYKVLEAIAWERRRGRDSRQEQFFSEAVALARAAQRPDGYLNSYVEVAEEGHRFTNPAMGHEFYCAGHLLQAAVADLRTGGDPGGLAAVAGRYADLLGRELRGELAEFVPGHPEIEMSLVEFARAARRPELVPLAADLIARRGKSTLSWHSFGPSYFSDDVPFEQASAVRGHAVRSLYLLSGAVDVYTETGAPGLLRAALEQWDDMVSAKTYLTGGLGSRHTGEAFGEPFELPPDRAYCETCAAIGSIMWNWRLLLVTGEARFADLIERTLYNGFLSGFGLDGRSFFYVNPLQSRDARAREPWYNVACCPPNVMRLLASLDHYVATHTEDGVQIHQFASGHLRAVLPAAGEFGLQIATGYPDDTVVHVRVLCAPEGAADLAVRVPAWADGTVTADVNGRVQQEGPAEDGYLHLRRQWSAGDEASIAFGSSVRAVRPDPRIDAVRSCVAFERGPLVYCAEEADLTPGTRWDSLVAAPAMGPAATSSLDIGGHTLTAITVPGAVPDFGSDRRWPYRERQEFPAPGRTQLRLIPYYAWANRSPGQMRVWMPETPETTATPGPGQALR